MKENISINRGESVLIGAIRNAIDHISIRLAEFENKREMTVVEYCELSKTESELWKGYHLLKRIDDVINADVKLRPVLDISRADVLECTRALVEKVISLLTSSENQQILGAEKELGVKVNDFLKQLDDHSSRNERTRTVVGDKDRALEYRVSL